MRSCRRGGKTVTMLLLEAERGQDIREIINGLFDQGLSRREVAANLEITPLTLSEWINQLGGERVSSFRFRKETVSAG